jgi:hypothetical protein
VPEESERSQRRLRDRRESEGAEDSSEPGWHHGLAWILLVDAVLVFLMLQWLQNDDFFGIGRATWFAATVSAFGIWNFVGFFARTGEIRSALAASVFIVWIVLFSVVINVEEFREQLEGSAFVESVWDLFNRTVAVVMAFYFGSEAVVQGIKLWQGGRTTRTKERLKSPEMRAVEEGAERDRERRAAVRDT